METVSYTLELYLSRALLLLRSNSIVRLPIKDRQCLGKRIASALFKQPIFYVQTVLIIDFIFVVTHEYRKPQRPEALYPPKLQLQAVVRRRMGVLRSELWFSTGHTLNH